jgi:misacylated tRNA(Ala) deacylase
MTTEWMFRDDAYLKQATARIVAIHERGVELDRTIFYPQGGGQVGDTGTLTRGNGERLDVTDTRKGDVPDSVLHVLQDGASRPAVGETLALAIDWERRYIRRCTYCRASSWPPLPAAISRPTRPGSTSTST